MRRAIYAWLILCCGLTLAVTTGRPAGAEPDSGPLASDQRYEGTQEAGGPVILVVQAEPPMLVFFEVEGVAGGGCSWDTITLENWGGPLEITEDRFVATNADGDTLEGAWVARQPADTRIEGTIKVRDPFKGCETPQLRWVASAVPAP